MRYRIWPQCYSNNSSVPSTLHLCLKFPKLDLNLLTTAVLHCCSPPAELKRLWGPQFLPISLSSLSPLHQSIASNWIDVCLLHASLWPKARVSEFAALQGERSTRLHARCSSPRPGSVTACLNLINTCLYWSGPNSCICFVIFSRPCVNVKSSGSLT